MSLNLMQVPFSIARSYMAISYHPANFRKMGNEEGLYLRTIHKSARTPFVCRIVPLINGKAAEYKYQAEPSELKISVGSNELSLCFADEDTILINGTGEGIGIQLDFQTENSVFDYIYEVPCDDHMRYMAECFKNSCRYLCWAQQGDSVVDQNWNVSTSDYCRINFIAKDGNLLAVLKENFTEWNGVCKTYDYAVSRKNSADQFEAFYCSMPTVPEQYEDARLVASYVNWSSIVKKLGFLPRDAMLMSKNWMCSIWSWDHCFNAIALAYNNPKQAWDQFMLMFDLQQPTGVIPDSIDDAQVVWNYCKPPIHGWALSRMMEIMEITDEQAEEGYDHLSRWTNWWLNCRDHDRDGICEYTHGNDSGWDNSTAFSKLPPVELPDLQAFLILQMETLSKLAKRLNRHSEAENWEQRAAKMMDSMLVHCFENGMPKSVQSRTHEKIPTESLILYLPIILGKRLPEEIRSNMINVLKSDKFLTEYGFATESPSSSCYKSDGYWRGPIWAPSTMLIIDGVNQCGETELVKDVVKKFSDMIQQSGCAENFDALTGEGLRDRAYTWTSSAFMIMAHEHLL